MAGRTVALTTVEVDGDPEQLRRSGRHVEEECRTENEGNDPGVVSATGYVRGDLVQAIHPSYEDCLAGDLAELIAPACSHRA